MQEKEKQPGRWRFLILVGALLCALSLTLLPLCALNVLSATLPGSGGARSGTGTPARVYSNTGSDAAADELNRLYQSLQENRQKIDELNAKLEQAKSDYAAALETKSILDQRVGATEAQISDMEKIIAQYDSMIERKQAQIDARIADMEDEYGIFLERLRQSYEEGMPGPLEIFFYSDSFIDMLTSIERMDDVLQSDQDRMDQLEKETNVLLSEKDELLSIQQEKQKAEDELLSVKKDLDARIRECGDFLLQLDQNIPALDKYLDDAMVAEDEINRELTEAAEAYSDLMGGNLSAEYIQSKLEKQEQMSDSIREKMESGVLQRGSEYFADGGEYIVPVALTDLASGYISSRFGYREYEYEGVLNKGVHQGVDFAVPFRSPIHAAKSGVVLSVGYVSSYGNLVVILHENGTQTRYAHCDSISVQPGEYVLQGEEIAKVGVTGNATGSCCHLEVRIRENQAWQAVDPLKGYVAEPEKS